MIDVGKTTTIKVKGKNVLKKEFKSSDSKVLEKLVGDE